MTDASARVTAWLPLLAVLAGLPGCATPRATNHAAVVDRRLEPKWQDAFVHTPELLLVLRPTAIRRDPVYGALFDHLFRLAKARSAVARTTTLEALAGSEEILVGLDDPNDEDLVAIFRGVPANLDPETIAERSSDPMFRLKEDRGSSSRVPEYERTASSGTSDDPDVSLFVVAERTWVFALGRARDRVRSAFASPRRTNRATVEGVEDGSLFALRVDAPSFARRHRLDQSRAFGALAEHLVNGTISLEQGKSGVLLTLRYADERSSVHGESVARDLLKIFLEHAKPDGFVARWLKDARIERAAKDVQVRAPIPTRLLDELPNVSSADLSP